MRPCAVYVTTGNASGVAVTATDEGHVVYPPDTGVSEFKTVSLKNPYGDRGFFEYDAASSGGTLNNRRLLNNPITYFYDGVRVLRNGWIFVGAGDGVGVIDPETGLSLSSIRIGGGESLAVSLAFGKYESSVVGRGGV